MQKVLGSGFFSAASAAIIKTLLLPLSVFDEECPSIVAEHGGHAKCVRIIHAARKLDSCGVLERHRSEFETHLPFPTQRGCCWLTSGFQWLR